MIRTTLATFALAAGLLQAQQPFEPSGPPRRPEPIDGPRPGPQEGMRRPDGSFALLKALGLSPDQEAAVRAVLEKRRASGRAAHRAAEAKEDALRQASEDPAATEAQLRALHAAASEARFQALLEHRTMALAIDAILTPEQRAKARRIREGMNRERDAHWAVMEEMAD
jgi:Spy/CpxP family protein refolding chaperone